MYGVKPVASVGDSSLTVRISTQASTERFSGNRLKPESDTVVDFEADEYSSSDDESEMFVLFLRRGVV